MIVVTRGYGPGATIAFVTTRGYIARPIVHNIVDTTVLNKPIDYFLAGDVKEPRKGFAPGQFLRNIFRE